MKKPIHVDAEAEDVIAHAIVRYEHEREGLGAEFWDELKTAMRTLEAPGPEWTRHRPRTRAGCPPQAAWSGSRTRIQLPIDPCVAASSPGGACGVRLRR